MSRQRPKLLLTPKMIIIEKGLSECESQTAGGSPSLYDKHFPVSFIIKEINNGVYWWHLMQ